MIMLNHPLPPGFSLWRFPNRKSHEDFCTVTGHGSNWEEGRPGPIVAIYDECQDFDKGNCTEAASWAYKFGARRMKKQPKLTPLSD
jgi:hypothetical protein